MCQLSPLPLVTTVLPASHSSFMLDSPVPVSMSLCGWRKQCRHLHTLLIGADSKSAMRD